jgi:NADP-dependent 3-hydroxy acid dehydrogenase YdfG
MTSLIAHQSLENRVAVVIGASSGIGAATAQRLAQLGARVAVVARRTDRLEALASAIAAQGRVAVTVPADVTDKDSVADAARVVAERFGSADLVVNTAGIQLPSALEDVRAEEWQQQIDVNVTGVMNVFGAFLPQLVAAAAAGRPSDLVLTSSFAAKRVLERFSVYSGTKAFLTHFARIARIELGRTMVRVSTIEPGVVDTEGHGHVTDPVASGMVTELMNAIEVLQPADVAETIAFVASAPRHVNLSEITVMPTTLGL